MNQKKSPRVSAGRRSTERRKSAGAELQMMETSKTNLDEVDGLASGDTASKEDEEFVLRTVNEDQLISKVSSHIGIE